MILYSEIFCPESVQLPLHITLYPYTYIHIAFRQVTCWLGGLCFIYKRVFVSFRSVLLPGLHCELQPGSWGSLQVHPSCLQDRPDQGGGEDLQREQLLRPWACQELSQGSHLRCGTVVFTSIFSRPSLVIGGFVVMVIFQLIFLHWWKCWTTLNVVK